MFGGKAFAESEKLENLKNEYQKPSCYLTNQDRK